MENEDEDFAVVVLGGRKENRERAALLLGDSSLSTASKTALDKKKFQALSNVLQAQPTDTTPPSLPASPADGTASGWLLHQGKLRGHWKKAWFVLKPPYLYQFQSEHSPKPKSTFYVSFALADRISAEDAANEAADINHIEQLNVIEEKACSLRINVYTTAKLKTLAAPSEATMDTWLAALDASVREHTQPGLLAEKFDAAQQLKPILFAQMLSEVDAYLALKANLRVAGLMSQSVDPMLSTKKAKGGKLALMRPSVLGDESAWEMYYFCLVDGFVYYYKEVTGQADAEDGGNDGDMVAVGESMASVRWKGCIHLKFAKVGPAPEGLVAKKASRCFEIVTPLRSYILRAKHDVSADEWMAQLTAAQSGVPLQDRHARLALFDVDSDPMCAVLRRHPGSLSHAACIGHPVTLHFFGSFISATDGALGEAVLVLKEIVKFKRQLVPEVKIHKAHKIASGKIEESSYFPADVKRALAEQLADDRFIGDEAFLPVEAFLQERSQPFFADFVSSPLFAETVKATGPKYLEITRDDDPEYKRHVPLDGELIVGRGDPRDDGHTYLQLWRENDDSRVSREHCRLYAGSMILLVTDLGSQTGTRYTPGKKGLKIKTDSLAPGRALYLGAYVLTYRLGDVPDPAMSARGDDKKKKGGGLLGKFGKKK